MRGVAGQGLLAAARGSPNLSLHARCGTCGTLRAVVLDQPEVAILSPGVSCGEFNIEMAPSWIEDDGDLAAFGKGCYGTLCTDDGDADSTCSGISCRMPIMAVSIRHDFLAKDGAAGDGPVELLQLPILPIKDAR